MGQSWGQADSTLRPRKPSAVGVLRVPQAWCAQRLTESGSAEAWSAVVAGGLGLPGSEGPGAGMLLSGLRRVLRLQEQWSGRAWSLAAPWPGGRGVGAEGQVTGSVPCWLPCWRPEAWEPACGSSRRLASCAECGPRGWRGLWGTDGGRASSGCQLGWDPEPWILGRRGHSQCGESGSPLAMGRPAALPSRRAERASSHFSREALRLWGCVRVGAFRSEWGRHFHRLQCLFLFRAPGNMQPWSLWELL